MTPEAYEVMARTEDEHWWFAGRRRILAAVIEGLALPDGADLLEIGAGTGGNLEMLGRFGRVQAVEMDEFARRKALEKTGRVVRAGRLPDALPFVESGFDLVCLFDVLEHVEEDLASLRTLRRLLKPGGRILLTVPAHPWLWSGHDVKLRHVRRYTAAGLAERAEAAGCRIDRLCYFNLLLFPLAVAARFADRLWPGDQSRGEEPPAAPLNRALLALFASEARWLRRGDLPYGVSLLAVLSNP